ncbi:MAG: hypothetical protein AAF340_17500 [Pseudomonadota bacterium]
MISTSDPSTIPNIEIWLALGGIFVAFLAYLQAIKILRARLFAEYTKRFSEIEAEFLAILGGLDPRITDEAKKEVAIDISIRKYLNLCSEEFHLYNRGLIEKEVWGYWTGGMSLILRNQEFSPIIQARISEYQRDYPKFHIFLSDILAGKYAGPDTTN